MAITAQNNVTFIRSLLDLYNSHQSNPAWLDKSLAFFAEDCEIADVPSATTSRGPDGYKQLMLFFAEGFPGSSVEITNLFATEDQVVVRSLLLLSGAAPPGVFMIHASDHRRRLVGTVY